MLDVLTTSERRVLRRALQIARSHLEHDVRNWEHSKNDVLANLQSEIREFTDMLNEIALLDGMHKEP